MFNPNLAVIYGEIVLSLYPILVKVVDTNILTQTLARFLVFPAIAIAFGPFKYFTSIWGNPFESFVGIMHGLLNLSHVIVSYISFKLLPAGSALSLFYTYPIFNVIGASFLLGETFSPRIIPLFIISLIGVYLIATAHLDEDIYDPTKYKQRKLGIIMGILAAITEAIIFIFIRSNKLASVSPFYTVNHLYPAGLVVLLLFSIFNKKAVINTDKKEWIKLISFNALLGFTGYFARFYGIAHVSTIVFSLLSFIGVLSGFAWDELYKMERPTKRSLIGGILIASSIAFLRFFH